MKINTKMIAILSIVCAISMVHGQDYEEYLEKAYLQRVYAGRALDMTKKLEHLKKEVEYRKLALPLLKKAIAQTGIGHSILIRQYIRFGDIAVEYEDFTKAKKYYKKAFSLLETTDAETQKELAKLVKKKLNEVGMYMHIPTR